MRIYVARMDKKKLQYRRDTYFWQYTFKRITE